ncbi:Metallophos domain-containing protein [Fusarium sp. LHS14.1]|nr:Metallophos domain-containing protein [Fusarium sp. LHS14.1]
MRALLRALGRLLHLSSTAKVQVLSDLHLEVGQQYLSYTFPATAPLLLLGGDIGRLADYDGYLKFLETQVCRYKKVFLVLGNHEFYGLDYEAGLKTARRLEAEPTLADKLLLLHRARWDDPDSALTILGCTLWSSIPKEAYSAVQSKVHDFKKINEWSVESHNKIHAQEAAWLQEEVAQATSQKRRLLVATHHAPSVHGTSRPEHTENPWTCAFATNLTGQDEWDGVRVWVFGHTHYSTDLTCNGIRLVANQRGYVLPGAATASEVNKKERDNHSFDVTKIVSI